MSTNCQFYLKFLNKFVNKQTGCKNNIPNFFKRKKYQKMFMFPSVYLFLSSSDESDYDEKMERKFLRDKSDPYSLPDEMFIEKFRLNKEAFRYVLEKLNIQHKSANAVPPILQLACTLSLLSSGRYLQKIGNDCLFPLAQSTMSKATSATLEKMEEVLCFEHINFDIENNFEATKKYFKDKYGLPGVIGCMDSAHILMHKPLKDDETYLNKNGVYSLNTLIICDHEYKINAINSRYGGSMTDSSVWQLSDEYEYLEEQFALSEEEDQDRECWLFGDAAYPLTPWCITPYERAEPGSPEERFNQVHSQVLSINKKTIAMLKYRWRVLLGQHKKLSRYNPQRMARFINICAALHNICVKFKVPFPSDRITDDMRVKSETAAEQNSNYYELAKGIRDKICSALK